MTNTEAPSDGATSRQMSAFSGRRRVGYGAAMPSLLRYSSYRGRRLRVDEALLEKFAMSRVGYWFLLKVAPWIDRAVIPRTGGRLSSMGVNKIGLLVTIGAKSGQRRTPVSYTHLTLPTN